MHRGRRLVLVVADDSATRCNFVTWLSNAGYRCLITDNVAMALWYLRRLSPTTTAIDINDRSERFSLVRFLGTQPTMTTLVTCLEPAAFALAHSPGGRAETRCS